VEGHAWCGRVLRTGSLDDLGQWGKNGASGRGVEGAQSHGCALGQQLARQQSGAE
jgi:hypothetical protein